MKRTLAVAIAFGVTVGTAGIALAQPTYGPNATYYDPYYAAPPPPAVTAYPPAYPYGYYGYGDAHSGGGAARAYSYWGAQKSN
ncbi:MAG TPA: hypothetical protein VG270_03790 [Pseudolabrys sp.]|jgi:hypothetical protein|nr:hypothetical protein [Pseudolabrys sp.]